jgi:hypothetical protein
MAGIYFLLIPTSSGYLNKFRVSQRIVGSGYLKNFGTKKNHESRIFRFKELYFKKLERTTGFHERTYPKVLGGYLI